jgi:cytochrome oxidase Cu insertion factor (SCO1/SenC/PrrC family)
MWALGVGLLVAIGTTGLAAGDADEPFEAMRALRPAHPLPASDITFQALDGRPARLGDLRGRPVLLTFFTTW